MSKHPTSEWYEPSYLVAGNYVYVYAQHLRLSPDSPHRNMIVRCKIIEAAGDAAEVRPCSGDEVVTVVDIRDMIVPPHHRQGGIPHGAKGFQWDESTTPASVPEGTVKDE